MIRTVVGIEGMMCNRCEAHMNEAIKQAFEVKKVTSSHTDKQTVILSQDPIDETRLKEVVSETGYTFVSVTSEPYEKKFSLFGI